MKPSSAKAKGRNAENQFIAYLQDSGWPYAERRRLNGIHDRGDVTGIPGVTIEIKSGARIELAKWMGELEVEMDNDNTTIGFLAIKPKGKTAGADYWCLVPPAVLVRLLKDAGW
jgi:hypothetical protein